MQHPPRPELLEDNYFYVESSPFSWTFPKWHGLNRKELINTHIELKTKLHTALKADASWVSRLEKWSYKTCGTALEEDDAIDLLIDVLWLVYEDDLEGALECIVLRQLDIYSTVPPKINGIVDSLESDDEEDEQKKAETTPSSRPILNARNHTAWNKKLDDPKEQMNICQDWAQDLLSFFRFPGGIIVDEVPASLEMLVDDLRQMRAVSPKIWNTQTWHDAVHDSGLANGIALVCRPDTLLETSSEVIAQSFRDHRWKESLGEVLDRWTPKAAFTAEIILDKVSFNYYKLIASSSYRL
ncbi:hypothetical protein Hypma_013713 [Hypsizygus marmoreus]|uniref:Uncharacterized protein n=1 Tax=Hypsizygus marmoreus TaxID=39966 RepID=A0A369JDL2_HYPMA|nr:hypothetical protein Hypma_013713 [Hypsizygus marmoreus]